jgi:hypothetical protein
MPGTLYLARLPPLSHDARLRSFGVYGMADSALASNNAIMALYADDGSGNAPAGNTLARVVTNIMVPTTVGQVEETPGGPCNLTSGTFYWLGIMVDSTITIAGASDPYGKGKTYEQPFSADFPHLSSGGLVDNPGVDLGLYINVQDID